jgi:hypothetical protein
MNSKVAGGGSDTGEHDSAISSFGSRNLMVISGRSAAASGGMGNSVSILVIGSDWGGADRRISGGDQARWGGGGGRTICSQTRFADES